MKSKTLNLLLLAMLLLSSCTQSKLSFSDFGAKANSTQNASKAAAELINALSNRKDSTLITVKFPKGRYDFYEEDSFSREYYISNHDQVNPKSVGFAFENLNNIVIDGQGSELFFHGRMIPFALLNCENITLKNFSIDFELPALRQLKVLEVDKEKNQSIVEIYPKGNYRIDEGVLVAIGEGYEITPINAMAFNEDRRLTYGRQDVWFNPKKVEELAQDTLLINDWYQNEMTSAGERFALRTWYRPTPGIFISESLNTKLENIQLHYAEGMGLLAQMSENITLDGFSVCLRGEDDERYFTTQADATHFSACKGLIVSKNGLYEGMADDAINVHGTYLRVVKRINDNTLQAQYMHPQAWGFKWGEKGDDVQFVESEKMELLGDHTNKIQSIKAVDKETEFGAKIFEIEFVDALPLEISEQGKFGIENLTWTPEVIFSDNIIRNNRARGALFSTPKSVICENNLFDHTHGTAILLCGDCNGWYETGACKDVVIRNNRFINPLTGSYQFTNAAISIYPEIPNLQDQSKFFHSGIVIENNHFETFDKQILYAKSTDGIIFKNNTIQFNDEHTPYHWNKKLFLFEKAVNIIFENNTIEATDVNLKDEIQIELSEEDAVKVIN